MLAIKLVKSFKIHNDTQSHPTNPSQAQQTINKQSKTILSYPFISLPSFPSIQPISIQIQLWIKQSKHQTIQAIPFQPSIQLFLSSNHNHPWNQTTSNHKSKPFHKTSFKQEAKHSESHSFISNQSNSIKNLPLSIKQFHFTKINWTKWIIMKSKPETKRKLYPEWHQTHS